LPYITLFFNIVADIVQTFIKSWNQLLYDVLNLAAYRLWKLQRATRAVHNRAATCVAAGGGLFENQL